MQNAERSSTNSDNQAFLNDASIRKCYSNSSFKNSTQFYVLLTDLFQVVTQVLAGEGVGWLKLNRLKKLMEDENYRDLVVTKLNKGLNRKISPDDHIDDVVSFEFLLIFRHKLSNNTNWIIICQIYLYSF